MTVTAGCFLSPFLENLGLDEKEIGAALGLAKVVEMIGSGFAGAWADHRERLYPKHGRAQVMAFGILGGSIATLCHVLVTEAWHHIALRSLYSMFASLIPGVLDGIAIDYLGENKAAYGKERIHGAIWWALAHWTLAIIIERMGFTSIYMLTIMACPLLLSCIYVYEHYQHNVKSRPKLLKRSSDIMSDNDDFVEGNQSAHNHHTDAKKHHNQDEQNGDDKVEIPLIGLIRLLFASLSFSAFFAAAFFLSSGQAIADSFSFLFFESLGSSFTVMGWTTVLTVVFEAPIFYIAPQLLQKFGSSNLLLLATACYIVNVTGYSIIPDGHGWMVLLFEPLHGVTYACAQTSIVDFVAQLMPPGYQASGQGIANALRGLGGMLGLGLGGWVAEEVGDRMIYRVAAVVVAVGTSPYLMTLCLVGRKSSSITSHQPLQQHESDDDIQIVESRKGESSNV